MITFKQFFWFSIIQKIDGSKKNLLWKCGTTVLSLSKGSGKDINCLLSNMLEVKSTLFVLKYSKYY